MRRTNNHFTMKNKTNTREEEIAEKDNFIKAIREERDMIFDVYIDVIGRLLNKAALGAGWHTVEYSELVTIDEVNKYASTLSFWAGIDLDQDELLKAVQEGLTRDMVADAYSMPVFNPAYAIARKAVLNTLRGMQPI